MNYANNNVLHECNIFCLRWWALFSQQITHIGLKSRTLLIILRAGSFVKRIYEATEELEIITLCETFYDVLHWRLSSES